MISVEELKSRGVPEEFAIFVSEISKDDQEAAYHILNAIKKDVAVLKIKYSFSVYSGISILFINLREGKIEFMKSFLSTSAEVTKINIENRWQEVLSKLLSEEKNLEIDREISQKANSFFYSDQKFTKTLCKLMSSKDKSELDIKRFIFTYVPIILRNDKAVVRFSVEYVDIFQLYRFLKEIGVETQKDVTMLHLAGEPVLAPMGGKSPQELNKGDTIFLEIRENSDLAFYILKSLGAINEDNTTKPIPGVIKEIKPLENERVEIIVNIAPGVESSFVIGKDIKLKPAIVENEQNVTDLKKLSDIIRDYSEPTEVKTTQLTQTDESSPSSNLMFWLINLLLIIGGLLIGLLLIFI